MYHLNIFVPRTRVGCIKRWCASDVCLSCTSGLSREQRPKTKIDTEVAHVIRDSDTPLSRSKVNLQGAMAYYGGPPQPFFVTLSLLCEK